MYLLTIIHALQLNNLEFSSFLFVIQFLLSSNHDLVEYFYESKLIYLVSPVTDNLCKKLYQEYSFKFGHVLYS